MTDKAVQISITIKVSEREIEMQREMAIEELEESAQQLGLEIGQQLLAAGIMELEERLMQEAPPEWRNVGTEERWVTTSLGAMRYKRRVYLDEEGRRRKPVDECLGIRRYARMSQRVEEMGSYLASRETYRVAADQLSWLLKTSINHSAIQRMAWATGLRMADEEEAERQRVFAQGDEIAGGDVVAPVLYGESDGVWIHLQREKVRSAEVRVAILSSGRKQIGKDRYRLENKLCVTAIGLDSEEWQEEILRKAHLHFDLNQTQLLISGGDGSPWVRHSFDRIDIQQEFLLDRFHLHRAARRAFQDQVVAQWIFDQVRQHGLDTVSTVLETWIQQAEGKKKDRLQEFSTYLQNNQDGLLDLLPRGYDQPAFLGAIEGNVDKLVVHRMKGRGCSWRLPGVRAMLALCRNREQLKTHAFRYRSVAPLAKKGHRSPNLTVQYSEVMQKSLPILHGPDQSKPWVRSLARFVHAR